MVNCWLYCYFVVHCYKELLSRVVFCSYVLPWHFFFPFLWLFSGVFYNVIHFHRKKEILSAKDYGIYKLVTWGFVSISSFPFHCQVRHVLKRPISEFWVSTQQHFRMLLPWFHHLLGFGETSLICAGCVKPQDEKSSAHIQYS